MVWTSPHAGKARLRFLREHPLCVTCLKEGIVKPATDVDHVIPHGGTERLFWDEENWQALCHECHSQKTAMDG
ncbi:MAG TPA: HNH endonuclease signature motif containing protein [Nitrospiraceae bacterium]|nr:HNH endonuclease signature motif containing protein [Nitrospiraceae bacterium]